MSMSMNGQFKMVNDELSFVRRGFEGDPNERVVYLKRDAETKVIYCALHEKGGSYWAARGEQGYAPAEYVIGIVKLNHEFTKGQMDKNGAKWYTFTPFVNFPVTKGKQGEYVTQQAERFGLIELPFEVGDRVKVQYLTDVQTPDGEPSEGRINLIEREDETDGPDLTIEFIHEEGEEYCFSRAVSGNYYEVNNATIGARITKLV